MSGSKHPKTKHPTDKDLEQDPGIGRTKGTHNPAGRDEMLEGENTFEGDTLSDTRPTGEVDPDQRGRTNK